MEKHIFVFFQMTIYSQKDSTMMGLMIKNVQGACCNCIAVNISSSNVRRIFCQTLSELDFSKRAILTGNTVPYD